MDRCAQTCLASFLLRQGLGQPRLASYYVWEEGDLELMILLFPLHSAGLAGVDNHTDLPFKSSLSFAAAALLHLLIPS